jgi:uncharacterized protein YbjT (DUF2867 family)
MNEQKIIVIGGNGHLGSAATEGALKTGAEVVIVSPHAKAVGDASAIQASISDKDALADILLDATTVIVSVEADWTPQGLQKVYVEGMQNVVDTVDVNAQIIFMGNIGVTDKERLADYNKAKLQAEQILRDSGHDYTIIRPSWIISGHTGVKIEQGDNYTGRRDDVSHDQLASAIEAIIVSRKVSSHKTFELYGGSGEIDNWGEAFKELKKDEEN